MKKQFHIIFLFLMTYVLIAFTPYSAFSQIECTTILVGRKATEDGSVIIAHTEDMGRKDSGKLWYQSGVKFEKYDSVYIPYETIPEVQETYSYWAHGNSDPVAERYNGAILTGINEFGVAFGCNTMYTRDELIPEGERGIQRYSIRRLIMERARTSKEAVELIGELIDTYGQSGMVVAYLIADPDEAWVVETAPRHWVARRIQDDKFHIQANQYTIENEWDLASSDLVEYAIEQGWYDPSETEFNFKYVYGDSDYLDRPFDTVREKRAAQMLKNKIGSITVQDLKSVMRSHYEGTEDYYYPPHDLTKRRPICVKSTQAAMVWHLRRDLPVDIGSVMWYAASSPCISIFVPVFSGAAKVPEEYLIAGEEFNPSAIWWLFDAVQRTIDTDYKLLFPIVKEYWTERKRELMRATEEIRLKSINEYQKGTIENARELLSEFTYQMLKIVYVDVKDLNEELRRKSDIDNVESLYKVVE